MKTVLLTEDNPDMQELVQLVLMKSGYRLVTAPDGQAAIDLCMKDPPDLVLMDLKMPNLDGFEATALLRQKGFDKPIVVLTASESEQDRKRAKQAGCNDYILKTLDMADLERVVDRFLIDAGGIE